MMTTDKPPTPEQRKAHVEALLNDPNSTDPQVRQIRALLGAAPLPLRRTEAGYPNCPTCDGGGCLDCTEPGMNTDALRRLQALRGLTRTGSAHAVLAAVQGDLQTVIEAVLELDDENTPPASLNGPQEARSAEAADENLTMACDWSDYRRDYGASPDEAVRSLEHRAFKAGWTAGRHGDQSGVLR